MINPDKEQADKAIKRALEILEEAHHLYYCNCGSNEEAETDEALCDAIEALQTIVKE